MKKNPWKLMTTSAMIAAMLATGTLAPVVQAASPTQQQTTSNKSTNVKVEDKYLGPEGLKKALEETGSHVVVMDAYALTVIKMPDINLQSNAVKPELIQQVKVDQATARGNASQWLDSLKPNLIQLSQDIVNFGTKFDKYRDNLTKAIDEKNVTNLRNGVQLLAKDVDKYKQETDVLVTKLTDFRDKLTKDSQNFDKHTNDILAIMKGQEAGIPVLEQQIKTYQDSVKTAIGMIAGGSVALAWGVGFGILTVVFAAIPGVGLIPTIATGLTSAGALTAGGILVGKGNALLQQSRNQITSLTANLTNSKQQVVLLENAQTQTKMLRDTISLAIDSAQALANQWQTMSAKYKNLASNVGSIPLDEEMSIFIKADLQTAEDSWLNLKEFADELYTQVKTQVK
ncbi:HBL/NHE enterotoxin family protein [Bacillus cereus]|uniref:HBL/NHE enterotoxin family protein n=1 Tax=Bacillus cereus TaxID=1396 RepID=UPI000BED1E1C|nr:HBL/NHE enterotoxin family protein [Bacillus cereus]PEF60490.1 enterotoxin [Bacillus cereus]